MFSDLLVNAKKEGVQSCSVACLVEKNDQILLLELYPIHGQGYYELPYYVITHEDSMLEVIEKSLVLNLNLSLSKVIRFLTYKDDLHKRKRTFYFVVTVKDPEDIVLKKHHSFAWVDLEEVMRYPIDESLREVLDLYKDLKPKLS